jgi:hypothetical protein
MTRWNSKRSEFGKHVRPSFSLFGEDRILFKLMHTKMHRRQPGFYVDIGCAGPFKHSNTAFFYLSGWNGIVVDPIAENISAFNAARPEDIAVRALVSNSSEPVRFEINQANTDLSRVIDDRTADTDENPETKEIVQITPVSLASLLDSHMPESTTEIDILDIDTEDHDISVLESNDWRKYQPRVILIEERGRLVSNPGESETHRFLSHQGYSLHSSTFITRIYTARGFAR